MIAFGPGGNETLFYDQGGKSSTEMPKWLHGMGLSAYEYQCNRGVRINEPTARKLGEEARKYGIALSIHGPYFISLSNPEASTKAQSIKYITDSMEAALLMGADRVVVHAGSVLKMTREEAFRNALSTLKDAVKTADDLGLGSVHICPETMGKVNQLGNVEEIIRMCEIDERIIPTIDFGHVHVRDLGCLNTSDDFMKVLTAFISAIGHERMKNFHTHFSRIEYSKGGEKKHWTLDDTQFGPNFELLIPVLKELKLEPRIICESEDKMARDAAKMKEMYENYQPVLQEK